MTINDVNITTFGAQLLGYDVGASNIENNTFDTVNETIYFDNKVKRKILTVTIYFSADTREIALENMSKFIQAINGENEISFDDDFIYNCIYQSNSIEKKTPQQYIVTYIFSAIQKKALIIKELEPTLNSVDNKYYITINYTEGTLKTPCKYTIIPNGDEYILGDTKICNVSSNSLLIIDGIKKVVTEDNENKFVDTELYSFPFLNIGINTIEVTDDSAISCSYYPLMI